MRVEILTTAHWTGDPRLNRHVEYLKSGGHDVRLHSWHERSRLVAMFHTFGRALRTDADVVIFPDPEMFVLGSLGARVVGKRPIIDIHENYAQTAVGRAWVPGWARRVVSFGARLAVGLGRILAWRTMVAAPELAKRGDFEVLNIPPPDSIGKKSVNTGSTVVYVGDVTTSRGAEEMARLAPMLNKSVQLLIIGRLGRDAEDIFDESGAADARVVITGRLDHRLAWNRAADSIAGLSLLRPVPAYVDAVGTKIWEYMAAGIPPVVSDLPGQRALVGQIHPDLVCRNLEECAKVVDRLERDHEFRSEVTAKGLAIHRDAWERHRPDRTIQEAVAP